LNTVSDSITILKANLNDTWQAVLSQDWVFKVISQETSVDQTADIHRLNVLPQDTDGDNIPNNMSLSQLLDGTLTFTYTGNPTYIDLPFPVLFDDFDTGVIALELEGSPAALIIDGTGVLGAGDFNLVKADGTAAQSGEAGSRLRVNIATTVGLALYLVNNDFVYFTRTDSSSDWELADPVSTTVIEGWYTETAAATTYPSNWESTSSVYRRLRGRTNFNFSWFHSAERFFLIDPSQSNIIDMFVVPRGYYVELLDWLNGELTVEPQPPSPLELRTTYGYLLDSKMISDTVVLHPGEFKLLFGDKAQAGLRATFKVIRPTSGKLTDNEVKTRIVGVVEAFFDVNLWEFGETFFYTELAAAIHDNLKSEIDSVVLVPTSSNNQFGDMFQVVAREDEILQADIGVEDIEIVQAYTSQILRQDI